MGSITGFIQTKLYSKILSKDGLVNVGNAERLMSLAAGILISYYAIKNQSGLIGKSASLAGGLLLARGSTGYCPVNKIAGRDSQNPLKSGL